MGISQRLALSARAHRLSPEDSPRLQHASNPPAWNVHPVRETYSHHLQSVRRAVRRNFRLWVLLKNRRCSVEGRKNRSLERKRRESPAQNEACKEELLGEAKDRSKKLKRQQAPDLQGMSAFARHANRVLHVPRPRVPEAAIMLPWLISTPTVIGARSKHVCGVRTAHR